MRKGRTLFFKQRLRKLRARHFSPFTNTIVIRWRIQRSCHLVNVVWYVDGTWDRMKQEVRKREEEAEGRGWEGRLYPIQYRGANLFFSFDSDKCPPNYLTVLYRLFTQPCGEYGHLMRTTFRVIHVTPSDRFVMYHFHFRRKYDLR